MLSKPGEDEQEELNLRQKGQRGDKFRGHFATRRQQSEKYTKPYGWSYLNPTFQFQSWKFTIWAKLSKKGIFSFYIETLILIVIW